MTSIIPCISPTKHFTVKGGPLFRSAGQPGPLQPQAAQRDSVLPAETTLCPFVLSTRSVLLSTCSVLLSFPHALSFCPFHTLCPSFHTLCPSVLSTRSVLLSTRSVLPSSALFFPSSLPESSSTLQHGELPALL